MEIFTSVISQMLYLFLCILIGYVLKRRNILPDSSDKVISKLESEIIIPCLVINTFYKYCSPANLSANRSLLFYSVAILAFTVAVAYILGPRFADGDHFAEGIYKYTLAIDNFGFIGNALVLGMYGEEMLFKYLIFTLPITVFVYAIGVPWISTGSRFTLKSFMNASFISMIAGILLGLAQAPLPGPVTTTLSSIAACFSPLAMILTGVVIAKYDLKKLFRMKKTYLMILIKMIAMPLLVLAVLKLLKVPAEPAFMIMMFTAMPLSLNTIVYPAANGQDTTIGASLALVSNIVGLLTVPLILSLAL